jgi:acyl-CoA synthetase (AMP-forming)/AMP-acid ligase II
MVIFLGGGLALEWLLRVLVDEWWPLPWFILIMAAQVVVMVIPERQYARFRVWLEHLASYKLPRGYEIVAMLPRDEAGKIRRSKLRDERGG